MNIYRARRKTISLFFSGLTPRLSFSPLLDMLILLLSLCANTNEGVTYIHVQKLGQTLDSLINILLQDIIFI